MKKLILITSILLIGNLCVAQRDIGGSEITYKALPQLGNYEITLVLYRWCGGLQLCNPNCGGPCNQIIQIVNADNAANLGTLTLSLVNVREATVRSSNCGVNTNCALMGCKTTGLESGIERYEFKGIANLGPTSGIASTICNIRFVWTLAERSPDYNTITITNSHYTFAQINRCISNTLFSSSPVHLNNPIFSICGGNTYQDNIGAIDYDLQDSLSYSFAPALTSFSSSVTYVAPYTYNQPMPWTGIAATNITCDPRNGEVRFTPSNTSQSSFRGLITVEIKQWRRIGGTPTLLGITRREWDVIVLPSCGPNSFPTINNSPLIFNKLNLPTLNYAACANKPICITITAKDTNLLDSTYISWDTSLTQYGASLTPNYGLLRNSREDSYSFCWTPHDSLIRAQPYYFTLRFRDNRCPTNAIIRFTLSVSVLEESRLALRKKEVVCNTVKLNHGYDKLSTNAENADEVWQIARDTNDISFNKGFVTFPAYTNDTLIQFMAKPGIYYFRIVSRTRGTGLRNASCEQSILDSFRVLPFALKGLYSTQNVTCTSLSNGVIYPSAINGIGPYTYRFDNNISFISRDSFYQLPKGNYFLGVRDAASCVVFDTIQITEPPSLKQFTLAQNAQCNKSANGKITIRAQGGTPPYSYALNQNILLDSIASGLNAGKYRITTIDKNNCSVADTIQITENNPMILLRKITPHPCNGTAQLEMNAIGGIGAIKYALNDTNYQASNLFTLSQSRINNLKAKDSLGCSQSDSFFVSVPVAFGYSAIVQPISCYEAQNGSIQLIGKGSLTGNYVYKMENGPLNNTGFFNYLDSGTYRFSISDDKGCSSNHTEIITRPFQFLPIIIGDTVPAISKESTYRLAITPPGFTYKWRVTNGGSIVGKDDSASVKVLWGSNTLQKLNVVVFYGNGLCKSNDTLNIKPRLHESVQELSLHSNILIYPNPASTELTIETNNALKQDIIQIQSVEGKVLFEQELMQKQTIDLTQFPSGILLVKVGTSTFRVVKF